MSYSRDSVKNLIVNYLIDEFSSIPEEFHDLDMVRHCLLTCGWSLSTIPKSIINDEIRVEAILDKAEQIEHISISDTKIYRSLALSAISKSSYCTMFIDPSVFSKSFMLEIIDVNPDALENVFRGHLGEDALSLVDDELIVKALSNSAFYLNLIKPSQISDEAIRECLKNNSFNFGILKRLGKLHIATEFMLEGNMGMFSRGKTPSSAYAAVTLLMKERLEHSKWNYRTYLRQFPTKDVAKLLIKTPARRKKLLEIYSTEELLPVLTGKEKDVLVCMFERDLGL